MQTRTEEGELIGPARLLEGLVSRFGAFEAIAFASLAQAEQGERLETPPPMDPPTASAVLEFGKDLRQAFEAAEEWVGARAGGAAREGKKE